MSLGLAAVSNKAAHDLREAQVASCERGNVLREVLDAHLAADLRGATARYAAEDRKLREDLSESALRAQGEGVTFDCESIP